MRDCLQVRPQAGACLGTVCDAAFGEARMMMISARHKMGVAGGACACASVGLGTAQLFVYRVKLRDGNGFVYMGTA